MKGVVFTGNRTLAVRDFAEAEPGHGQVRVRIHASGICGSDLHVYRGSEVPGQIGGHEPCGVIDRVGPGVRLRKIGERVTVHHHVGCGVCEPCARGETVACPADRVVGVHIPGSFAESLVVDERNCVPLSDSVSFIDGAFMACVGGTIFAALRRLESQPHEVLAVYGLGPVGLSAIILGKAMGLRVIGVDILSDRMEAARRCGLEQIVDPTKTDPVEAIRAFSKDRGFGCGAGADCLIETSGSAAARRLVIPSLRREGRAAIVGVSSTENVINPSDIHGRAVKLIGSVVFPLGWLWDLARFCAVSGTSFEPAVTHRFALEDAPHALPIADSGKCGKVIFLPPQPKSSDLKCAIP